LKEYTEKIPKVDWEWLNFYITFTFNKSINDTKNFSNVYIGTNILKALEKWIK